jgi:hypothetical protein
LLPRLASCGGDIGGAYLGADLPCRDLNRPMNITSLAA